MNRTVALIDADVAARDLVARALSTTSLRVDGYGSARAFFSVASFPGPACAVIDGALPDMTGPQLQAELARRGLLSAAVFQVGPTQVGLAVSLMKDGAVDVLVKPLDQGELRQRIHAVLASLERAEVLVNAVRERLGRLTQRELEVVILATSGLSNKDVAEQLSISFRTVEVHRRNAMRKTGTANIVELTHFVARAWRDDPKKLDGARPQALTDRERDVLRLGRDGFTNKAIATQLAISARTVEAHRGNVHRKGDEQAPVQFPDDPQLTLWGTGEPVRAVLNSETDRSSVP